MQSERNLKKREKNKCLHVKLAITFHLPRRVSSWIYFFAFKKNAEHEAEKSEMGEPPWLQLELNVEHCLRKSSVFSQHWQPNKPSLPSILQPTQLHHQVDTITIVESHFLSFWREIVFLFSDHLLLVFFKERFCSFVTIVICEPKILLQKLLIMTT